MPEGMAQSHRTGISILSSCRVTAERLHLSAMTSAKPARRKAPPRKSATTLVLIALFKLVKGLLLLAVGVGAVKLLHRDIAQTISDWVDFLRVDPDNRFIHGILT